MPLKGDGQNYQPCYCGFMTPEDSYETSFLFPYVRQYDEAQEELKKMLRRDENGTAIELDNLESLTETLKPYLRLNGFTSHLTVRQFMALGALLSMRVEIVKIEKHLDKIHGRWVHPPYP